ncbi:MAG: DNA repair protein RadC [Flavobacteriales bacterium]|mgnify:CR=1 FL=1|nr:DNA repair protein RadC [Flavobacteriales bacterium]MDG1767577.1 DNA repair protein RadC [Flavobacteriales bacterium]
MAENYTHSSIQLLKEEDRPRERILKNGIAAASDTDLLTVILGTGSATMGVAELAHSLLETHHFDLSILCRMSIQQLQKAKGIGPAKAITIAAAFELGRRLDQHRAKKRVKISSSKDVHELLRPLLVDLAHEEFWILCLNRANMVLSQEKVSSGGLAGTVADPKVIFEKALSIQSSAIVLAHNHPSGNLKPSASDDKITKQLKNAGEFLDLPIIDHLIISVQGYFSYADEGKL